VGRGECWACTGSRPSCGFSSAAAVISFRSLGARYAITEPANVDASSAITEGQQRRTGNGHRATRQQWTDRPLSPRSSSLHERREEDRDAWKDVDGATPGVAPVLQPESPPTSGCHG